MSSVLELVRVVTSASLLSALAFLAAFQSHSAAAQQIDNGPWVVGWGTNASELRGEIGRTQIYVCPVLFRYQIRAIWGTDIYTDDSPICVAASHAGLITPDDGGVVLLEVLPGQDSYQGTTRYGITSDPYGPFLGSYRLSAIAVVEVLNNALPAAAGEAELTRGFSPQPMSIAIEAGGLLAARDIGEGCGGYIDAAPTYRFHYTPDGMDLVVSVSSSEDTSIVLRDPRGQWRCDDDSAGGTNPSLFIREPVEGEYALWVGTANPAARPSGTILDELPDWFGEGRIRDLVPANLLMWERESVVAPDFNAEPVHGTRSLNTGFQPQPDTVIVSGGGDRSISGLAEGCLGFVTSNPSFRLAFTAGPSALVISAIAVRDTVLLVRDPEGRWYCDDDSLDGFSPSVIVWPPYSGSYDIWIGTHDGEPTPAVLGFREESPPAK